MIIRKIWLRCGKWACLLHIAYSKVARHSRISTELLTAYNRREDAGLFRQQKMEITIQNLSKQYPGGKKALDNVNTVLSSPSFVGLLGPNGAGKTTLMKLLTLGLLPSGGEILLDGASLVRKEKMLKQSLGYLPQEYGLYEELTVYQFLDYMAALKGLGRQARPYRQGAAALRSGGQAEKPHPHPFRGIQAARGHCAGPAGRSGDADL